jgi:hypothetical protein
VLLSGHKLELPCGNASFKSGANFWVRCFTHTASQSIAVKLAFVGDRLTLEAAVAGTHYNEISNDGRTLYSATRSTGQIEEGPVGYSVTNIDGNVVSWRFVELGKLPIAVITSPSDERLLTKSAEIPQEIVKVRAKFWGEAKALEANADLGGQSHTMKRIGDSHVWETDLPIPSEGTQPLKVSFKDAHGKTASDEIRLAIGERTERNCEERDQDNALEAWPEHGLLGTQLGPNKNGKKW